MTSANVNLTAHGTFLKAPVVPAYSTINMTIVISYVDMIFGPSTDPNKCAMATSMLMTHNSNKAI